MPRTATAPDLSNFIAAMPVASLSEMPPESNVIPFPTTATVRPRRVPPGYSRMTRRGGWSEPPPTAKRPPHFNRASSFSSKTVTLRPVSFPSAFAISASRSGVAVSAGRLAMSRVQRTFSAILTSSVTSLVSVRSSEACSSPSWIVTSSTPPSDVVRYRVNSYPPRMPPSTSARVAAAEETDPSTNEARRNATVRAPLPRTARTTSAAARRTMSAVKV